MAEMLGKKILHYKILEKIGQGGMGIVYKAMDTKLDRPVALKFLSKDLSTAENDADRFIREAKTVSSLNHPNICTLYDIADHDGQRFMVMEYLDGRDLRHLIPQDSKNPVPVKDAVKYILQIAEGLGAAHTQGIVHRDIKPENVIVRKDGIVQILDFGLAKLRGQSKLTKEGTTVGTLAYMAPEQLQNGNVDARADIFSLGVIFYEMLAGQLPFKGDYEASMIYSILNDYPQPVFELRPELGEDLNHIVMECLEKDPDERYQSVRELAKDLKRFTRDSSGIRRSQSYAIPAATAHQISSPDVTPAQTVPTPAAKPTKASTVLPWIVSAFLFAAAAALAFLYIQRPSQPAEVIQASILPPDLNSFTFTIQQKEGAHMALSPDGTMLAFVATDSMRKNQLWVRRLSSISSQPLAGTENATYPFWSPDNRFIAFFADDKLKKINAAGGPALTICDAPSGRGGSWNENDMIIFAPDQETGLFQVQAAGGTAQQITTLDSIKGEQTHRWPVYLPDGQHFLFFARISTGGESADNAIYMGSGDGSVKKLIPGIRSNMVYASGYLLYARENTLMAQPFNSNSVELSGDAFPIAENLQYSNIFSSGVFTASQNGKLVYQAGKVNTGKNLLLFNREGQQKMIIGQADIYREAFFSPDASKLAIGIYDVPSRQIDVWIHDLKRDIRTRFTFSEEDDRFPIWSPDGQNVVFSTVRDGKLTLYIKAASGAGKETLFYKSNIDVGASNWSVDGKMIAITESDPTNKWDLALLKTGKNESSLTAERLPFLSTEFREFFGVFSPDTKWMAYTSDESGQFEVYVQPVSGAGGKWQVSKNGGWAISWKNDGSEIYYESMDEKLMTAAVSLKNGVFEIGNVQTLFELPGSGEGDVEDISQDGQSILISVPVSERSNDPFTLVTSWDLNLRK